MACSNGNTIAWWRPPCCPAPGSSSASASPVTTIGIMLPGGSGQALIVSLLPLRAGGVFRAVAVCQCRLFRRGCGMDNEAGLVGICLPGPFSAQCGAHFDQSRKDPPGFLWQSAMAHQVHPVGDWVAFCGARLHHFRDAAVLRHQHSDSRYSTAWSWSWPTS